VTEQSHHEILSGLLVPYGEAEMSLGQGLTLSTAFYFRVYNIRFDQLFTLYHNITNHCIK
jgi:hypothetical protein